MPDKDAKSYRSCNPHKRSWGQQEHDEKKKRYLQACLEQCNHQQQWIDQTSKKQESSSKEPLYYLHLVDK
jgi:hypothetical protein